MMVRPIVGHRFRTRCGMPAVVRRLNGLETREFFGEVITGKLYFATYWTLDGRSTDGPGYDLVHHFGKDSDGDIEFSLDTDDELG